MERFVSLLRKSPYAFAFANELGIVVEASQAFCDLIGYDYDELMGMHFNKFTHEDDNVIEAVKYADLVSGKVDNYHITKRYIRKNGEIIWVSVEAGLDKRENDTGKIFYGYIIDITKEANLVEKSNLYNNIENAITWDEFSLYYQPIVDVMSLKVVAYEALIRWHKNDELIYPDQWIPKLDHHIYPTVCRWVFNRACDDRAKVAGLIDPEIGFACNISPVSLSQQSFHKYVKMKLKDYALKCCQIWIEITEDGILAIDDNDTGSIVNRLGCPVVIDDFGTGYSNLASIFDYHPSVIKIDKSIVDKLPDVQAIGIIEMLKKASDDKFKLVAEGIENESKLAIIRELGVDYAQGWLFGKPKPLWEILT